MAMRTAAIWSVLAAVSVSITAGCSAIYTAPGVDDGSIFGEPDTDLDVRIIAMTNESTIAANLTPYVPARLPVGLQMGATGKIEIDRNFLPQVTTPPTPVAPSRTGVRPGFIPDNLPPPSSPEPYRLGITDVLLLAVNNAGATLDQLPGLITAQSKRQGFVIQDDGAIAIPDVGRVRVAGMTVQDAEAAVFQALVTAGVDPSFSIEIAEFNSQRVSIGGAVRSPSLVPVTLKPLFLNEAINTAGGLTATDPKTAKIQLFRGGQTYQMSVDRFLSDPSLGQIILRDGDSIYVIDEFDEESARAFFNEQIAIRQQIRADAQFREQVRVQAIAAENARRRIELDKLKAEIDLFKTRLELGAVRRDYAYLAGEVRQTVRFPLPFENKAVLADLLFDKTTIDIKTADYGAIYVLRRSTDPEEASGVTAYHLNAANAVNLVLASQFELRAGDVVFITEQPIASWNRAFSQALPQLFLSAANIASGI